MQPSSPLRASSCSLQRRGGGAWRRRLQEKKLDLLLQPPPSHSPLCAPAPILSLQVNALDTAQATSTMKLGMGGTGTGGTTGKTGNRALIWLAWLLSTAGFGILLGGVASLQQVPSFA